MIELNAKDWFTAWGGVQKDYGTVPHSVVDAKIGNRAFSFNNEIKVETNDLNGLSYDTVGYLGSKQRMIWHHYFDPEAFEYVAAKLKERVIEKQMDLTILNYFFLQKNNQHNLDACISNIYITAKRVEKNKYDIEYEFHIRTSEATKRLCADFVFFSLLIDKFNEVFTDIDTKVSIVVKAKALYAQPPFFLIARELIAMELDQDHWFSKNLDRDEKNLFKEDYKFKMGKRVRNYIVKIREANNETNP